MPLQAVQELPRVREAESTAFRQLTGRACAPVPIQNVRTAQHGNAMLLVRSVRQSRCRGTLGSGRPVTLRPRLSPGLPFSDCCSLRRWGYKAAIRHKTFVSLPAG